MNLTIQLTPEDYVQSCYLHMRPRPIIKWAGYFLLLLTVIVLGISFCFAFADQKVLFLSITLMAVLASLAFSFFFLLPRRVRKIFRQQKIMQSPYSFLVTDEAVITKSEVGDMKLTWDYFVKWKEGKSLFMMYQSDVLYHMVPKRCFASPEEMAQFRQLLQTKLGPAGV